MQDARDNGSSSFAHLEICKRRNTVFFHSFNKLMHPNYTLLITKMFRQCKMCDLEEDFVLIV